MLRKFKKESTEMPYKRNTRHTHVYQKKTKKQYFKRNNKYIIAMYNWVTRVYKYDGFVSVQLMYVNEKSTVCTSIQSATKV